MDKSSLFSFSLSDRDSVDAYFVAIFTYLGLVRHFSSSASETVYLGNFGCDESPED